MKNLILAAIAVGVAAMPAGGHAAAAKKIHKVHHNAYEARGAVVSDPAFGNAAAGGNNANSMSGSNSPAENANGRTSGAGGFGGH